MRLQCNDIQALYVECVRKEGGKINMRAGEGEEASRFKIYFYDSYTQVEISTEFLCRGTSIRIRKLFFCTPY